MGYVKLKGFPQPFSISTFLIIFSVACLAILVPAQAPFSQELDEGQSLTGVVKSISIKERKIVIKSEEGKRQQFSFTDETLYKGVFNEKEIKVKHRVTIWYVTENNLHKALKIKVMPELGC